MKQVTRTSLYKGKKENNQSSPRQTRYAGQEKRYGDELRENLSTIGQTARSDRPVITAAAVETAAPTKNTEYVDTEAIKTAIEKLKNLAVQEGFAKDPTDATIKPTTTSGGGGGGGGGANKGFFSGDDKGNLSYKNMPFVPQSQYKGVETDNLRYGDTFPDGAIGIGSKSTDDFSKLPQYQSSVTKEEPRQTVAALPSDYKETEAKAFLDAKAYQAIKDAGTDKTFGGQDAQVNVGPGNMGTPGLGTYGKVAPSGDSLKAGSFGISQAGKDQAAINRGVVAAKKTGIPTKPPAGSFGISQAGKDKAAIQRGVVAAKATGIPTKPKEGSFGISSITRKPSPAPKKTTPAPKKTAPAQKRTTPAPKKTTPAPKKTTPAPAPNKRAEAAEKRRVAQAAEAKRKSDAAKKAEAKKKADADAKAAENKRAIAAEKRRVAQKAEADRKAAEAKKAEADRKAAEAKRAEAKRKAEAAKKAEAKKKADADAKKRAEAKKKAEAAKKKKSSSSRRRRSSAGKKSNTGSKKSSRGGSKSGGGSKGGSKSGGSKSNSGSKKSSRGAKGGSSSRSRGGTSKKTSRRTNRRRSRRRCDIRCKFDISVLTNLNLIRDDLAHVAYFVKELQEN